MNKEQNKVFLFAIAKEIQRSYECPVILLTQTDYADNIYNTLLSMHCAILQHAQTQTVIEILNTLHHEWLRAVLEVEDLQRRAKGTPRESVLKSVDYTMDCIKNRHKYFQQYINHMNKPLPPAQKALMQEELKTIKDMQEIDCYALLEKQKCLTNSADKGEFTVLVLDEIKELLNWLDRLYDHLALQLCELLELPQLPVELSKVLQKVLEEIARFLSHNPRKVPANLNRDKTQCASSRTICTFTDNSINRTVEKIKKLEDQIAQQKNEKSSAGVLALQHKTIFLEDRLESLENLKSSLSFLKKKERIHHKDERGTNEDGQIHFFNHLLPHQVRCRLVETLIQLWEYAINNAGTKPITSLMRNETKQIMRDNFGFFTVDKHGRKLYTKKGDYQIYQLNETNTLVPLNDDEDHVYSYDIRGRYYMTENSEKVYKAHGCASEYNFDTESKELMAEHEQLKSIQDKSSKSEQKLEPAESFNEIVYGIDFDDIKGVLGSTSGATQRILVDGAL